MDRAPVSVIKQESKEHQRGHLDQNMRLRQTIQMITRSKIYEDQGLIKKTSAI
mgnify:CR=1 FL=1